MKRNLLLLSILLCLLMTSRAQENEAWCPPGATWHYTFYSALFFPYCTSLHYSGDETVGGKVCKRITTRLCKTNESSPDILWHEDDKYTYEEDGVVYIWQEQLSAFDTLYNFNAGIGDTWEIAVPLGAENNPIVSVVVLDTGIEEINNLKLRKLEVEYSCKDGDIGGEPHTTTICERVGDLKYHLYFAYGFCSGYADVDYDNSALRCYQDDAFPLYETGLAPYCDYQLVVSVEDNEKPEVFTVKPNPATDYVDIESESSLVEVIIYDISGRKVLSQQMNVFGARIDLSHLSGGTYFVLSRNVTGATEVKKIVVHR